MNKPLCPCYSQMAYEECCKAFHEGELPTTALVLMRSRYSAFALGLADYIMDTTHPDNHFYTEDREAWRKSIDQFSKKTRFENLEIIDFVDGDEEAFVTFKAHLIQGGRDASFQEKSRFLKVKGKWFYHSGKIS